MSPFTMTHPVCCREQIIILIFFSRLEHLSTDELREAIVTVLSEDPRSTYRRKKCSDRLYYCVVDTAHLTSFFDEGMVEVLRVSPIAFKQHLVS